MLLALQSPSSLLQEWEAGTIDGAFVWGSTYRTLLERGGKLLVSSGTVANWDKAIFQMLGTSRKFAEAHPAVVTQIVATFTQMDKFARDPRFFELWLSNQPDNFIASIADAIYMNASSQADRERVAAWLPAMSGPSPDDQVSCYLVMSCLAKSAPNLLTVVNTADFLRGQKRIASVLPEG